jgi:hypothetical protein
MHDPHFFYNFLLMITSLAKKQNKKQKNPKINSLDQFLRPQFMQRRWSEFYK